MNLWSSPNLSNRFLPPCSFHNLLHPFLLRKSYLLLLRLFEAAFLQLPCTTPKISSKHHFCPRRNLPVHFSASFITSSRWPPASCQHMIWHPIECFHSRGQDLCKLIATKESICIRKEFNSHRISLGHQHGRRFFVLGHQYGRRDVMWKHSIETPIPATVLVHYWPMLAMLVIHKRIIIIFPGRDTYKSYAARVHVVMCAALNGRHLHHRRAHVHRTIRWVPDETKPWNKATKCCCYGEKWRVILG